MNNIKPIEFTERYELHCIDLPGEIARLNSRSSHHGMTLKKGGSPSWLNWPWGRLAPTLAMMSASLLFWRRM